MDIPSDEIVPHSSPDIVGRRGLGRRAILKRLAILGAGTSPFRHALADEAAEDTPETVPQAERNAGPGSDEDGREDDALIIAINSGSYEQLHATHLDYDVPPALSFLPQPKHRSADVRRNSATPSEWHPPRRPRSDEDLAFLPVTELSALVRSRRVSSMRLTELYLGRLKRFDPLLKCVVTITERVAREQAKKADAELAAGIYRGPLHGIPWGAKDMIGYPGYPTTWGAKIFRERVLDEKATVAARLEQAGAVLVAKLSLGAFADGDCWFGGRTRNPWDPRQGSSGSSAGSASAAAAGLIGFALGGETLGSIISPCQACGASGLRPTFGRVSRHGCLPLTWSMDKLGPIARSLEDCALVLDAIHGADGLDPAAVDRPFSWPPTRDVRGLRVGYIEGERGPTDRRKDLEVLRGLGVELVPIKLPKGDPLDVARRTISVEADSIFDGMARSRPTVGRSDFPQTGSAPAADYLRDARLRTLLLREMADLMRSIDVYTCDDPRNPAITNLTGHPAAVLPFGGGEDGGRWRPGSITFTGRLHDEETLLAVAHAFQQAAGDHLGRPPLERFLTEDITNDERC